MIFERSIHLFCFTYSSSCSGDEVQICYENSFLFPSLKKKRKENEKEVISGWPLGFTMVNMVLVCICALEPLKFDCTPCRLD